MKNGKTAKWEQGPENRLSNAGQFLLPNSQFFLKNYGACGDNAALSKR